MEQTFNQEEKIEELKQRSWWNEEMETSSYTAWIARTLLKGKEVTRGYRNNNPCNIRLNKTPWEGRCVEQKDGAFFQFSDLKYGFRAALKTLYTYYYKYGLYTILGIIERWAPAADGNNPKSYAKSVSEWAGCTPKKRIPAPGTARTLWCNIVVAMAKVENGTNGDAYDDGFLQFKAKQGWDMAWGEKRYE